MNIRTAAIGLLTLCCLAGCDGPYLPAIRNGTADTIKIELLLSNGTNSSASLKPGAVFWTTKNRNQQIREIAVTKPPDGQFSRFALAAINRKQADMLFLITSNTVVVVPFGDLPDRWLELTAGEIAAHGMMTMGPD